MAVCTTPTLARSGGRKSTERHETRFLTAAGEMTLKVSGNGQEARLVQIRSAKCTVGSAVGCTLRVRGAGVGPLACWILRGPGGTVVRRLHGPATLNGGQFEEAELKNGDRLRVGGVELEVVDCNKPAQKPAELFRAPATRTDAIALEAKLADAMANAQRMESQARQGFQSSIVAADRADQLRDALAAAHEQLEDTCRELTAVQETITVQNTAMEAQKLEMEAIHSGNVKSVALVEEARRETAAAVKQCAATGAELAQVRFEAAKGEARWEEERLHYERRLEQRAAEIEALRNDAAGQTAAMTVVLGREGSQRGELADFVAQLNILHEQIAAKDGEIESLSLIAADQAAQKGKLEALQCEYEGKCNELNATQARLATAEQQLGISAELDARSQSIAQREEGLAERQKSIDAAEQRFAEERAALAAQTEQLTADRQRATQELGQAAQELERAAQARQQIEQDREALSDCEARKLALEERELQLESQAAELADQVVTTNERAIELDAHREQLAGEREVVEQRVQSLQRQHDEQDARAAELEAKAAEIESLREELNAQIGSAGQEQQKQEAAAETPAAPGTGETPVASDSPPQSVVVTSVWQSPEEMERESLEHVVDDVQPPAAGLENPRESADVDSVLSRLVKAGLWRGNEAADAESGDATPEGPVSQTMIINEPLVEPAAPRGNREVQTPRPAEGHGDEESIESYMDRLMKRVRGDSTRIEPPAKPMEPPQVAPSEVVPIELPVVVDESGEMTPRRTAPELSNMSAMRELANSAARSAIDKHVRMHTGKQVTGKLLGACFTVGASLVLAYWAWNGRSLPAAVGAGIGGTVGLYWTYAAIRRLLSLMKLNRPRAEQPKAENVAGVEITIIEPVEVNP